MHNDLNWNITLYFDDARCFFNQVITLNFEDIWWIYSIYYFKYWLYLILMILIDFKILFFDFEFLIDSDWWFWLIYISEEIHT